MPTAVPTAQTFDLTTAAFTTTTPLDRTRVGFTMAPLPGGRVLVAGGAGEELVPKSSTRIWDPVTGTWSEGALMTIARLGPVSAVLRDGRVLVAGGETPSHVPTATVETYDPAIDRWTATGSLPFDNPMAAAVALSDGRVLALQLSELDNVIFGGALYDPGHGTWAEVEGPPGKWGSVVSLVALSDGTALLIGDSKTVLRYDPKAGWSAAGTLREIRHAPAVVGLGGGRVLVAGGFPDPAIRSQRPLQTAEVFDSMASSSAQVATIPDARGSGVAVLLVDGSVLVAGGSTGYEDPNSTPSKPNYVEGAIRWIP
jgi:hypothetical protein